MSQYANSFVVTEKDLDENNHVNNVRYVEWTQEIARNHWNSKVDKVTQNSFYWVVRKHEITYYASAVLGDGITITTYVDVFKGPLSKRIVEIKNNKTDQLLVKSVTDWCMMDKKSLKPTKVPQAIIQLF